MDSIPWNDVRFDTYRRFLMSVVSIINGFLEIGTSVQKCPRFLKDPTGSTFHQDDAIMKKAHNYSRSLALSGISLRFVYMWAVLPVSSSCFIWHLINLDHIACIGLILTIAMPSNQVYLQRCWVWRCLPCSIVHIANLYKHFSSVQQTFSWQHPHLKISRPPSWNAGGIAARGRCERIRGIAAGSHWGLYILLNIWAETNHGTYWDSTSFP